MIKKYSNNVGAHVIEGVGIMVLVTTALIAAIYFLKKGPSSFPGFSVEDRQLREAIKQDRANAALVIVGRVAGKSANYQEGWSDGDPMVLGFGYWDFNIESVERGHYPYKKISVYFGWTCNLSPPTDYPFGSKLDYKVGDRVRAFLSYGVPAAGGVGPDRPCYFTALAYLSLELLETQKK